MNHTPSNFFILSATEIKSQQSRDLKLGSGQSQTLKNLIRNESILALRELSQHFTPSGLELQRGHFVQGELIEMTCQFSKACPSLDALSGKALALIT